MSYHSFSLDPRTILGVGPGASPDEIHDAYRARSKKHHPDLGGDEWAFRLITRAYEVLKATSDQTSTTSWHTTVPHGAQQGQPDWNSIWTRAPRDRGSESGSQGGFSATEAVGSWGHPDWKDVERPESQSEAARSPVNEPDELRTVDVELIWTRFEKEGSERLTSTDESDDATLSVCMVVEWPPHELVPQAAEFDSTSELLRTVIDVFEKLRDQKKTVAARSRIEDGRFVGWLSHADVLTAQDAFLTLRDALQARGLTINFRTRDERVPFDRNGVSNHL